MALSADRQGKNKIVPHFSGLRCCGVLSDIRRWLCCPSFLNHLLQGPDHFAIVFYVHETESKVYRRTRNQPTVPQSLNTNEMFTGVNSSHSPAQEPHHVVPGCCKECFFSSLIRDSIWFPDAAVAFSLRSSASTWSFCLRGKVGPHTEGVSVFCRICFSAFFTFVLALPQRCTLTA